jgi:hypothetical protein
MEEFEVKQEEDERFKIALVEEIWRRNLNRYYKQHPGETCNELMEKLLYGRATSKQQQLVGIAMADCVCVGAQANQEQPDGKKATKAERRARRQGGDTGDAAVDRSFSTFAHLKWGTLRQSEHFQAQKDFGKECERPPTLQPHGSGDEGAFQPRPLAAYSDHPECFDELVAQQLALIEPMNKHLAKLFDDLPLGKTCAAGVCFSMELQRLVLVQALRFRTNSAANSGVSNGEYKNIFDYFKGCARLQHRSLPRSQAS